MLLGYYDSITTTLRQESCMGLIMVLRISSGSWILSRSYDRGTLDYPSFSINKNDLL